MLIEFKFSNYRSCRDENTLSMEATGLGTFKNCLIPYKTMKLLPTAAIYGKNGGGKSNVIRAFWLAVQFIRNAQRTQHANAPIPVRPFLLNDYSRTEPTAFEFIYVLEGVKYIYGFSATRTEVIEEYLYHAPHGQKALVFQRSRQNFMFRENAEKKKRELIAETVAPNQLFFSVACTMNEKSCIAAMRWFREYICFSQDYSDIPQQLLEYWEDPNMLRAISNYAENADLGIQRMQFDLKSQELNSQDQLPADMPEGLRHAVSQFMQALAAAPNEAEVELRMGEVQVTSFHKGVDYTGEEQEYPLQLADESEGTIRLMALAPAVERVLQTGGVLLVDELEQKMHPMLMEFLVNKFQAPSCNPNHAQLIFTTHNTTLLNCTLIRKDQVYFVDKDSKNSASVLYSIAEFSTPTAENVLKNYLVGKYGAIPDLEIEGAE